MQYWLIKADPKAYGIEHLTKEPNQITGWGGIRNYQARNFMRDQMQPGDMAFFYHSSCAIPAIVGTMEIVSKAYADLDALDPESPYYDPKATPTNPRWFLVDVQLKTKLKHPLTLQTLKQDKRLQSMMLLKPGCRLSVQPVSEKHWQMIMDTINHDGYR